MIISFGDKLIPYEDFLALPFNDNDIIIVVRNSNLKKPLAIRWKDFKSEVKKALTDNGGGSLSGLTLYTNDEKNVNQSVLNISAGDNISLTIDDNGKLIINAAYEPPQCCTIGDMDGGFSFSNYMLEQNAEGGYAAQVFTQNQYVDGGDAVQC